MAETDTDEDLTLTVEEITYKTGTYRTKYTRTARVLNPSKAERHWNDEERKIMDALRRELGEANGNPTAEGDDDTDNPFEGVADGTELTIEEATAHVEGITDTLAEIDAEREREQAWGALLDKYPILHGTGADPDDVEAALTEADETGEQVEVASGTDTCSEREFECNLDLITYYATPDGRIDRSRTHTY